ncbi:MAG: ABC transporter permease [Pirellulales bacterium]
MSPSAETALPLVPRHRRFEPKDLAPLASLLVILVLMTIFTGGKFLRPSTAKNLLDQAAVLMVVSVGLTFVLLCGEIDLAVGMIALWTAVLCGWSYDKYVTSQELASKAAAAQMAKGGKPPGEALPPAPAAAAPSRFSPTILAIIAISLLTSILLGLLSGTLTVWARMPSFIITLAMMYISDGAARYLSRSETFNMPEVLRSLGNSGFKRGDDVWLPFGAVVAAVVALVGHVVLQHTRFGRYVYMTGGNREAARLSGVRTGLIVVACLAICGLTAGLGGLLNAGRLNSVSLDQNSDLLLSAVACVVLGGTSLFGGEGGIGRTIIGVVTFTVLKIGLAQINWIDDLARQLLTGVVLLAALVVNGLLARRRS